MPTALSAISAAAASNWCASAGRSQCPGSSAGAGGDRGADQGRIGRGVTLPLGSLRLAALGDQPKTVAETVERALAAAPLLPGAAGRSLYLVGGASRAIARLHMEHSHYPLHIIHQYSIARTEAEAFFEIIGRLSRKSLERITTIPRKRLETVPLAALVLRQLIAAAAPRHVVFSAAGLREGYAYGLMPAAEQRIDPLFAACAAIARKESRFPPDGELLQAWTAPLFPNLAARSQRLHQAASWLGDIAWSEHPDYRAELAFSRSLRMPFPAIGHADRVFIAAVLHARYGGAADDPVVLPTEPLLAQSAAEVRALGLALRLAYTMCGGVIELLSETWIGRDGDNLELDVPPTGLFGGETVQRRLDALARALGATAIVRQRRLGPRSGAPWPDAHRGGVTAWMPGSRPAGRI